ncbi:MAG: DNA mismatch repair protein MutT [Phenylobacterium sp. RIFCSPHIGHO2_01_FULL_69_31]|jgi:8-oxo-dGTP pyrophosphatase MutT (NUDIX family)|uniref:NUDIX domain-containing protein n=1 Tax=Phenylobacterium sp. RIFCSPHIGHO2_01_FULL_69_31 TaxID=1801944 RepID=UPI0008C96BEB|nr:NUDIX hydrolase [Phenylobacterium sp. RIFCSPHIGHO2_01_FULL_69_31]OHB29987.1 MAG: DNA mismatch repair protein MutT [Phenylobacterium sp. RIFCSPHIGHO2_01_FULL_69_31]
MMAKPAWLRSHGKPWVRGPGAVVYDNPWISVTEYAATAPTGAPARYGLVGFKNYAIAILPLYDDGSTVLVGQNRFPAADYSWELPEGGGPVDEDPLESAKRELAEETGLQAAEWHEVMRTQLSNSVTDELMFGYLALGLSRARAGQEMDDTEALEVARVPFREALDVAMAGEIKDMLTVAMLLKAYHMAREGLLAPALARAMLG